LDNNISRSIDDALGEPEEFYDEDELDDWEWCLLGGKKENNKKNTNFVWKN
jgi:hypothetical protein